MESARSALVRRFESMKAGGLVDMKFFLGQVSEETVEAVCAEVNRLHDLLDKGRDVKEVTSWADSNRPGGYRGG